MKNVILCNTTAQVMGTVPWTRAITLIYSGKASSIKDSDRLVNSQYESIFVPEIIMLSSYEDDSFRYEEVDGYSKRAIHCRDNWTCAYCGDFGSTIDHIIPQSLGGSNRWDNVITSCGKCNNLKDSRLLTELGWELLYEPVPIRRDMKLRAHQKVVDDYLLSLQV